MKPKLMAALTLPVLLTAVVGDATAITTFNKCSGTYCSYDTDTYRAKVISTSQIASVTNSASCVGSDNCWVPSKNVCLNPDGGYDQYLEDCGANCSSLGYDAAVLDGSAGSYTMGCACLPLKWQTYKTGVQQQYVRAPTSSDPCAATPTNVFKCAPGYWGTPDSNGNGCISCANDEEMECLGGEDFTCGDGFYKSIFKLSGVTTGQCVKCPNSKDGKLGVNVNTEKGVSADSNGYDITDCYISPGNYKDDTGTFTLTDDCYYSNFTEQGTLEQGTAKP